MLDTPSISYWGSCKNGIHSYANSLCQNVASKGNRLYSLTCEQASSINATVDLFGEGVGKLAIPFAAKAYDYLGDGCADVAEVISEKLEFTGVLAKQNIRKTIKETQYDPLSTESVLIVSRAVEGLAKQWAQRTPTEDSRLHFIDQSSIGMAQQIYAYVKEANEILSLPAKLKEGLDYLTFESWIRRPRAFFGRTWPYISAIAILFQSVILFTAFWTLEAIEYVMPLFSMNFYQSIRAAKKFVKKLQNNPRKNIAEFAKDKLIKEETTTRKDIVCNVATYIAESTLTTATPIAMKASVAIPAYHYAVKPLIKAVPVIPLTDYALDGALLTIAHQMHPEQVTNKMIAAHAGYKLLAKPLIEQVCPYPGIGMLCDILALGTAKLAKPDLVTVKTLLGLAGYTFVVKPAIQSLGADALIDTATVSMLALAFWNQAVVPTLTPYYEGYQNGFDTNLSHLYQFCKNHAIADLYPYIRAIKGAWGE